MNAQKRQDNPLSRLLGRLLESLSSQWLGVIVVVGVPLLLVLLGFWAWQRWGDLVSGDPRYLVKEESLLVPQQPPWVRNSDVRGDVVRTGSLKAVSLLEPQATARIARAFELHPWVKAVTRVRKSPLQEVTIQLTYRRPVAMVYQPRTPYDNEGWLAVDADSVLLPGQDFTSADTLHYPRIRVADPKPLGIYGSPYGDTRVVQAAQIASALLPVWPQLGLVDIRPIDAHPYQTGNLSFEIVARDGKRVIWGNAPGNEKADEVAADEKISRLVAVAKRFGPLGVSTAPAVIDLRPKRGVSPAPATAPRHPLTQPVWQKTSARDETPR